MKNLGTGRLGKRRNLLEIGRACSADLEGNNESAGGTRELGGRGLRGRRETGEVAQLSTSGVKFTAREGTMVEMACL
ncbi:MAG: hypothetical protein RLY67_468 [Pseudomonadota bacterium]